MSQECMNYNYNYNYLFEWYFNFLHKEDWLCKSCEANSWEIKKIQAIC